MWAHHVGRERMVVMVYESVRRDAPGRGRRGVGAARRSLRWPSPTWTGRRARAASATWEPPEGLVESLEVLYRPQVGRLADDWDLDLSTWSLQR